MLTRPCSREWQVHKPAAREEGGIGNHNMIKFVCSNCGQSIRVDDKYAGRTGQCPKCGTTLAAPERSSVIKFRCGNCGAKVRVPERYAGRKGRCPKCKATVVAPILEAEAAEQEDRAPVVTCLTCGRTVKVPQDSTDAVMTCPACEGEVETSANHAASEVEAETASPADEERQEERAALDEPAGRSTRRPLILAGGVTIVLVLALIGVVWLLWFSPPASVEELPGPGRPMDGGRAPVPVTAQEAEPVLLRFRPVPETGRTLRVTTRSVMSSQEAGQQLDVTYRQSFTIGLEAQEPEAGGTVPVTVTLEAIQVRTTMQNAVLGEYDSTSPQSEDDSLAGIYVPFVGKRFTTRLSDRSEIVDAGLDELFLAVAADRIEVEDDMMREQLRERAEEAIQDLDQQFGSRRGRTLALKQQLEDSLVFGAGEVRTLLDHLFAPLPAEPVQTESRWNDAIVVRSATRIEMPAAYVVTDLHDQSCTIAAEGERSMDDEPFVYRQGSTTVSSKLGGVSRATLTIDRPTGWLVAREQQTTLSGRVLRVSPDAPGQGTFSDVGMDISTTVTSDE